MSDHETTAGQSNLRAWLEMAYRHRSNRTRYLIEATFCKTLPYTYESWPGRALVISSMGHLMCHPRAPSDLTDICNDLC
jgi:hypothetical protein